MSAHTYIHTYMHDRAGAALAHIQVDLWFISPEMFRLFSIKIVPIHVMFSFKGLLVDPLKQIKPLP